SALATSRGAPARACSPRPRPEQRSRGRAFPEPRRDCIEAPAPPPRAPARRRSVHLEDPRTATPEDPLGPRPRMRPQRPTRPVEKRTFALPPRRRARAPVWVAPPTSGCENGVFQEPEWRGGASVAGSRTAVGRATSPPAHAAAVR